MFKYGASRRNCLKLLRERKGRFAFSEYKAFNSIFNPCFGFGLCGFFLLHKIRVFMDYQSTKLKVNGCNKLECVPPHKIMMCMHITRNFKLTYLLTAIIVKFIVAYNSRTSNIRHVHWQYWHYIIIKYYSHIQFHFYSVTIYCKRQSSIYSLYV